MNPTPPGATSLVLARPIKYCCEVVVRNGPAQPLLDVDTRNTKTNIEEEHSKVYKTTCIVSSTNTVAEIYRSIAHVMDVDLSAHSMFMFEDSNLVAYFPPGFTSDFLPFKFEHANVSLGFRVEQDTFKVVLKYADRFYCTKPSPVQKYGQHTNWQHAMVVEMHVDWRWSVRELISSACESMCLPPTMHRGLALCYVYKGKKVIMDDMDARLGEYFGSGNFPVHQHTYAYCARDMTIELLLVHVIADGRSFGRE